MMFSMMKGHWLPQILISFAGILIIITNGMISIIVFIVSGAIVLVVLLLTRNRRMLLYFMAFLCMSILASTIDL